MDRKDVVGDTYAEGLLSRHWSHAGGPASLHQDRLDVHSRAQTEPVSQAGWDPMRPKATPRVLFLCTHNAARSQMAEAILRHLARGTVKVESAGTEPSQLHPMAIETVQRLLEVDISGQRSKHVRELAGQPFDYVVTLCDSAEETCPVFPGAPEHVHWRFDDPAAVPGSDEDRYRAFREVAARLERRLRLFLVIIQRSAKASPRDSTTSVGPA
jgi:protein-tyrosine-phosphatase